MANSRTAREVHSPSDPLPDPPFDLGGRVVARGEELVLGDAYAHRPVVGVDAAEGDWVVVHVVARRGPTLVADAVEVVGRDVRIERGPGEADRLRARERGLHLHQRAQVIDAVRGFFRARGSVEVETPFAVPCPGLDVHLDAPAVDDRYWITSPEYQMKRLLAGGMPRIHQLARCHRRGEHGPRHNPEFTMLEWYRTFAGVDSMIEETEALVVHTAVTLRGRAELVTPDGAHVPLRPPFERLPVATAFARHAGVSEGEALRLAAEDEERFYRLLVDEVEPALAEGPPVVLLDYPIEQASLARPRPLDPRVAERFELYVGGVELCNGFGELTDPVVQRARFSKDQEVRRARGLPVYPLDERFLAALEEGLPPCTGNALGLDRLVMLVVGARELGDVLAFPEDWV